MPVIIKLAELKKLFDMPDFRKIHTHAIASLGGLGIFGGFIISIMVTIPFSIAPVFQYYIAAALIIFFIGLKDDILIISPKKKFTAQIVAAFLISYCGNLKIVNLEGFLNIYHLSSISSFLISNLAILIIINAYNLIDGIDGLAGSLGLLVTSIFGIYFFEIDLSAYAILSFAMAGSLVAFLIYNFQPAKIFMGDTGSMLIGLVISILVIKFINEAPTSNKLLIQVSPAIAFSILLIPILDTLRVCGIRMFNRRSPFHPDRNHIHHDLLKLGMSHRSVTIVLVTANLVFIGIAYCMKFLGCTLLVLLLASLFFLSSVLIHYFCSQYKSFYIKEA